VVPQRRQIAALRAATGNKTGEPLKDYLLRGFPGLFTVAVA